ncbi:hypothetical protein [Microbacterium sp. che218]|uniref:hypothetical protein n=1 Tax=Microbacterium sp. che218 TaxID=3140649 RepID=UPI003367BE00
MASPTDPLAVLGAQWAERERWETAWRGFLRPRAEIVAVAPVRFLDWTIDGRPLRDRLTSSDGRACEDITLLADHSSGDQYAIESLRALLSEDTPGMDSSLRFSDGRTGLLFCPTCGGLDCGAVTAEVRVTESTVEWRDVAYQDGSTGDVLPDAPAFTLRFDRVQYETTVRALLTKWRA